MSQQPSRKWFAASPRITDLSQVDDIPDLRRTQRSIFYWFSILCLIQAIVLISIGAYAYSHRHELAIYDLRDSWVFFLPGPRQFRAFMEQSGKADLLPSIAIDYGACQIAQALTLTLVVVRMLFVRMGWVKYPFIWPLKGKALAVFLLIATVGSLGSIQLMAFSAPPYDRIPNWITHERLRGYLEFPELFSGGSFTLCLALWMTGRI